MRWRSMNFSGLIAWSVTEEKKSKGLRTYSLVAENDENMFFRKCRIKHPRLCITRWIPLYKFFPPFTRALSLPARNRRILSAKLRRSSLRMDNAIETASRARFYSPTASSARFCGLISDGLLSSSAATLRSPSSSALSAPSADHSLPKHPFVIGMFTLGRKNVGECGLRFEILKIYERLFFFFFLIFIIDLHFLGDRTE